MTFFKMMNDALTGAFKAAMLCAVFALTLAACNNNSTGGDPAVDSEGGGETAAPSLSFGVFANGETFFSEDIDPVKKTINVAVPYFEGVDTSWLDIVVEDGTAALPVGADFSTPQVIKVTKDGVSVEYTVTVYVLFDGEEGLAQLDTYAEAAPYPPIRSMWRFRGLNLTAMPPHL